MKLSNLLFFLLLPIFPIGLTANPDSLAAVEKKLARAQELIRADKPDEAKTLAQEGLAVMKKYDDLLNWLSWHKKLGVTWRKDKDEPFEALDIFHAGVKGKWRNPQNDKEWKAYAWLLADIGRTYETKLRNFTATRDYYLQAARIFTDTLGIEDFQVAKFIYTNLGNAYTRLRDFDHAKHYLEKVKQISREASEWDKWAEACNDLGMMYIAKPDYPAAEKVLLEGFAMRDSLSFRAEMFLLENLGLVYQYLNDQKKASDFTNEAQDALSHEKEITPEDKLARQYDIYYNFGKIYYRWQKPEKAVLYFRKAEGLLTSQKGRPDFRNLALLALNLGNISLQNNKPTEARAHFQKMLQWLAPSFRPTNINENPRPSDLKNEPLLSFALGGKALSFLREYREGDNAAPLESALSCFELAAKVDSMIYESYALEGSRQTALTEFRWIKEEAFNTAFRIWQSGARPDLLEKMFALSEKSRAWQLLEGVGNAAALEQEKNTDFRTQLAKINEHIQRLENAAFQERENQDQRNLLSLENDLFRAKENKDAMLKKVAASVRQKGALLPDNTSSIADIRLYLSAKQALVEYYIQNDQAYIFIISPSLAQPSIQKIAWGATWSQMATTLKDDILAQNNAAYIQKARALYDHLVKPVLAVTDAEHLIIVPDGELWNVPFDALLTRDIPENEQRNFRSYPYLVWDKSISYGFSATLQLEMSQRKSATGKKLQVYAPTYRKINAQYIAARNQLAPLNFNTEEAEAIAGLGGGTSFIGADATKNRSRQSFARANFLHIAGHAEANHQNPNFSFIAFSNTGDTLGEPYLLYAHEIYNQSLPLKMVVLSGCETGSGPVWKGEGIISLARAFAYSGTRSIVTTLWSVKDKATKTIMVDFYKNLKNGLSKDAALQNAKRSYIENAIDQNRAHPLYWAAFTPIGDMEPVQLGSTFPWAMVLLGVGLAAVMSIWLFYKKSKRNDSQ